MAQYILKRKSRNSRRVVVEKNRFEIRGGSLILAFLLAFVIWLYIAGSAEMPAPPDTDPVGTGLPVSDAVPAEP